MALRMTKELSSGITGDYWKISKIVWETPDILKVYLVLFKNSDAKAEGRDPLHLEIVQLSLPSFVEINMSITGFCYYKIKQLPAYASASDA